MGGANESKAMRLALEEHLQVLPVLSSAVTRLLSLKPSAEDYFDRVVSIIEQEPNYAAKLLAHANSVTIRGQKPISKIRDAVVRIGARGASGLVTTLSVARVFVPTHSWESGLWLHAINVGSLARCLTRMMGPSQVDPEESYLAGLLHDVGRFILFNEAPDALKHVDDANWSTAAEMIAAETSICGIDHTELGARAAEKWKLPKLIVDVIRRHHQDVTRQDPTSLLVAIVQVADRLSFRLNSPEHELVGTKTSLPPPEILGQLLPEWYPVEPERALVQLVSTMRQAKADVQELMPWMAA